MKRHGRIWIVLAAAAVLIAGHGVILYYVSSYMALSVAAIAGVVVMLVVNHLGFLGPLHALLRKALHRSE